MKPFSICSRRSLHSIFISVLAPMTVIPATADEAIPLEPALVEAMEKNLDGSDKAKEKPAKATKASQPKARVFLTNGDKLSGLPQSIDAEQRLLFKSDSLQQTAAFPLTNVLSLNLHNWKKQPVIKSIARVQLQPRFREATGDTVLGELTELTPDSIKLKTWYGGDINLKRSMVQSLRVISNTPGNYYGPNSIEEWTLPNGDDTWSFKNGSLVSHDSGGIGRDIGLKEKSHISFKASWKSSMRFKFQLYSSDVSDTSPDAYYEVNINRSYAYMRTRGKSNQGARLLGGGRWKQISVRPEENSARFDVYVNRKTGSITVYINGLRACLLQSQNPDPTNLGTGLTFLSEQRYPLEISGITVTPWNGTTFPKPKRAETDTDESKEEDKDDNAKEQPPHRILLNNGDEVPGTVGKVEDGRMVIETKYTPIRIPINRIKSLNLGNTAEEPKKYREDVRAWFHSGGFITLKLSSLKDNKISGYSQAVGDVSFDLAAFSRIDFHIYDHKANEMRNKIR